MLLVTPPPLLIGRLIGGRRLVMVGPIGSAAGGPLWATLGGAALSRLGPTPLSGATTGSAGTEVQSMAGCVGPAGWMGAADPELLLRRHTRKMAIAATSSAPQTQTGNGPSLRVSVPLIASIAFYRTPRRPCRRNATSTASTTSAKPTIA